MNEHVQAVLSGKTEAYRFIVERYAPSVRALLTAHIADLHTVDDLAQETFLAAFESLERYDPARDFGTWIRSIARHKMQDHLRRAYTRDIAVQKLRAKVVQEIGADIDGEMEGVEGIEGRLVALRRCLERLPEQLRTLFNARYFQRRRVKDLAAEEGQTATAISTLLSRGRQQLRGCMEAVE